LPKTRALLTRNGILSSTMTASTAWAGLKPGRMRHADQFNKFSEGHSQIVLYQTEDGRTRVQVGLENKRVGLMDKTQVHPREVFSDVIGDRAASMIIAHNHPSGELRPSENDLKVHEQLIEAGKILGIKDLDHFIVTRKGYCSLQEEGFI
jgi:hypothetical protein